MFELLLDCLEGTFLGKGPNVQLIDHRLFPGTSAPLVVIPVKFVRVYHLAGSVHIARLKSRGRIGHVAIAIDPKAITRPAGRSTRNQLKPSLFQPVEKQLLTSTLAQANLDYPRL